MTRRIIIISANTSERRVQEQGRTRHRERKEKERVWGGGRKEKWEGKIFRVIRFTIGKINKD